MKKELHPAIGGIILVVAVALVAIFLWKATGGGGNKAPLAVGNPGPFSPGGPALGKGGRPLAGSGAMAQRAASGQ